MKPSANMLLFLFIITQYVSLMALSIAPTYSSFFNIFQVRLNWFYSMPHNSYFAHIIVMLIVRCFLTWCLTLIAFLDLPFSNYYIINLPLSAKSVSSSRHTHMCKEHYTLAQCVHVILCVVQSISIPHKYKVLICLTVIGVQTYLN